MPDVLAATPELRERELVKLAQLSAAVAGALAERGVGEPAASLAAEAGTSVLRVAVGRWAAAGGGVADGGVATATSRPRGTVSITARAKTA